MPREANAVDFWRGFALVSIFINHVPGIFYEHFTHRNVSISDSAELFVFLAGWSLGLLVSGSGAAKASAVPLAFRLGGRSLQLYAAHILISGIALAMLAGVAYLTENALILEWHNAASFFQDPAHTQIGIVLLTHQLGYFDILPLYVVLILVAPAFVIIDRFAPPILVPMSLTLYFSALVIPFTAPTWPVDGQWFFNPFAWQAIFVLGFVLARDRGLGHTVRRHITRIRQVALPVVIAGAIVTVFNLWPDPTKLPEPKLLFLHGKSFLTPIRLLQFLALAAVFSAAYPLIARLLPWLTGPLSQLGRNSLNVFCVGSLLSLSGQIIRYFYGGSLTIDTVVVLVGVALLWLTAWMSEWRQRLRFQA
ncbi:MAG TPA: OpgC domain-containing protein [Hyphomicrobiaceae bacterium]|nr:OpgC domain-containing protein [Hyphomicrobiaceae bacterium]